MITEVFFDVETRKLFSDLSSFDPGGLGVSIVSVLHRTLDESLAVISEKIQSFWEADFPDIWEVFDKADRVIGFNSKNFDVPVLAPYAPQRFKTLPHFDIMEKVKTVVGRRIGLDALAQHTLGVNKSDKSFNAVLYWNRQDAESLRKLKEYCEMDVKLTKDLYDFVLKNNHLVYMNRWNNLEKIPLDFSYPKLPVSNQISFL